MHYKSSAGQKTSEIIMPYNQDNKDFIDAEHFMTPEDKLSLNYHFGCETISTKVVQEYIQSDRNRIKRDLKQFEIIPSDATRR